MLYINIVGVVHLCRQLHPSILRTSGHGHGFRHILAAVSSGSSDSNGGGDTVRHVGHADTLASSDTLRRSDFNLRIAHDGFPRHIGVHSNHVPCRFGRVKIYAGRRHFERRNTAARSSYGDPFLQSARRYGHHDALAVRNGKHRNDIFAGTPVRLVQHQFRTAYLNAPRIVAFYGYTILRLNGTAEHHFGGSYFQKRILAAILTAP